MKELSAHITDEIKIHSQKEEKRQVKVGSITRQPGQLIFSINLRTQEIEEVEFDDKVINFETGGVNMKINKKENHWYCAALNKENAFKHFNHMAEEIVKGLKSK